MNLTLPLAENVSPTAKPIMDVFSIIGNKGPLDLQFILLFIANNWHDPRLPEWIRLDYMQKDR
jgi:hypothetical protein